VSALMVVGCGDSTGIGGTIPASIVGGVGISRRLRMDAPPPHRLSEPAVPSPIACGAREGTGIRSPLGYEKTVEFPREPHFETTLAHIQRQVTGRWHALGCFASIKSVVAPQG
jgi:hypothetical protein